MYLTPALEKISQALRCSETLAGVTLVALGNGAPETIIAVTSGGNAEVVYLTLKNFTSHAQAWDKLILSSPYFLVNT